MSRTNDARHLILADRSDRLADPVKGVLEFRSQNFEGIADIFTAFFRFAWLSK